MSGASARKDRTPVNLALLAPARRCNQSCPHCVITEILHEPVTQFVLQPHHYAQFVDELVEVDVALQSVSFLGYEVTLPEAWPYVEAALSAAKRYGIRRSFITNGMLLHKWADRIEVLDPDQISVSLDGGESRENDRLRGLQGAFAAALRSVERLLAQTPRFRSRMVVASCLHDEANVQSLLRMPALLSERGLSRWLLSMAWRLTGEDVVSAPMTKVRPWLAALAEAARASGVTAHFVDLSDTPLDGIPGLRVHRPGRLDQVVRLDPSGAVRSGGALMQVYDARRARRWRPGADQAAVVAGLGIETRPHNVASVA